MTVGKAGDKFEQEADATAQAVVQQQQTSNIQQKEQEYIQRITLATPAEDEKLGTAEARMEKDKYIQEKPQLQTMGEEKEEASPEVQEMSDQEEETPEVQNQQEEEESVNKMEEEEAAPKLQSKDEEKETGGVQMMEEEKPEVQSQAEEQEEGKLQTKKKRSSNLAPKNVAKGIKKTKGKGKPLSPKSKEEMEASFGTDFSEVVIHTDEEAEDMSQRLGAQAFTHGKDIYFNKDKYHPETESGTRLLAHELAHVIQQKGKKKK